MGIHIESMKMFLEGFLRKEFEDQIVNLHLTDDEFEILKAVTHYELYTSEDIRVILRRRVQRVIDILRPPGSGSGSGSGSAPSPS